MARIVEVRASAHSCPFESNMVRLGLGTNTKRDIVLVRIRDESGAVGLGEAHHGQNPTAMATVIQDGLGSLIAGADPLDSEGIWHRPRAPADHHAWARRRQHHRARRHRQRALGPPGQAAEAADLPPHGRCQEAHPRLRRRSKSWLQAPGRAGERGRDAGGGGLHSDQDAGGRPSGPGRRPRRPYSQGLRRRSRHRRRRRHPLRPARYPGRAALLRGEPASTGWRSPSRPTTSRPMRSSAPAPRSPSPPARTTTAGPPSARSSRGAPSPSARPTSASRAGSASSRRSPTWPPPGISRWRRTPATASSAPPATPTCCR